MSSDLLTRFRQSFIRSREDRLLDEDIQTSDQLVDELHLTELLGKETLDKLRLQGQSMQRSAGLINQLERQVKEIAEDLHQVNSRRCWAIDSNGTLWGFSCFGCLKKKKKKKKTTIDNPVQLLNETRWSSATEREQIVARTRSLARERREHVDFVEKMKNLQSIEHAEKESNEKKRSEWRDFLLEHHPLTYGYIDQPDRLLNEIDMSLHFTEINRSLDELFQITTKINAEVNEHNVLITQIGSQAMKSGDLLTDYTLLGQQILGESSTPLSMPNGQKILLKTVL